MDPQQPYRPGYYDDGNFVEAELDEQGGYYDNHGCYYDAQGNIYPPAGLEFQADEHGHSFLAQVTQEGQPSQDVQPEVEEPPTPAEPRIFYDARGIMHAPHGYEIHINEHGDAFLVPVAEQQPQEVHPEVRQQPQAFYGADGNLHAPDGYELQYDEAGNAYMVPVTAELEQEQEVETTPAPSEEDQQPQAYYDDEGNLHVPPGYEVRYDERGHAYMVPVTAELEQECPDYDEDQQPQAYYDEQGVLHVPPGYEVRYDERGHAYLFPKAGQQPQVFYDDDGNPQAPPGYDIQYDEEGNPYLIASQDRGQHAEVDASIEHLSQQMQHATISELRSFVETEHPWEAVPYRGDHKLSKKEKEKIRLEHKDELAVLGPNCRQLYEEKLGLKEIPKPRVVRFWDFTYIATPGGDAFVFPFLLRQRYPGYVRDIEAIEGSFDPKLRSQNPPKPLYKRPKGQKYPQRYAGEVAPPPEDKQAMLTAAIAAC